MKGKPIAWTAEELAWIEARATLPRRQLLADFHARFDRPEVNLRNLAQLCKRRGWLTGRDGRFVPGNAPLYRGGGHHPNTIRTQFRKGNVPHTWRGAGHESIDAKDGYVWIIVDETNPYTGAPTRRVQKHRWLWERANGPVPKGHVLKCLDGDKTNTDPANWKPVPPALLPRLNGIRGRGYDDAPAELKPTILAITELEHAVRTLRKGETK